MYVPGSQTTRGGANPRASGAAPVAFCCQDGIGTPDYIAFAAHNLACTQLGLHTPLSTLRGPPRGARA